MDKEVKKLPLKSIIIYSIIGVSLLTVVIFTILFFTSVINQIALCLSIVICLFAISLANLFNVSIDEDKKMFIYNLVFTCLMFACVVSLIVLLIVHPEALAYRK